MDRQAIKQSDKQIYRRKKRRTGEQRHRTRQPFFEYKKTALKAIQLKGVQLRCYDLIMIQKWDLRTRHFHKGGICTPPLRNLYSQIG